MGKKDVTNGATGAPRVKLTERQVEILVEIRQELEGLARRRDAMIAMVIAGSDVDAVGQWSIVEDDGDAYVVVTPPPAPAEE